MNNGISKLLATDGFIQVNKTLIKLLGLDAAVMIGELCAEYNYWQSLGQLDDEAFFSTQENIEENTGLSEHKQRKAINLLKEFEIISVVKKGLPAKNYYTINFDKLLDLLNSSCLKIKGLEDKNFNINNNKSNNKENNKTNSKELVEQGSSTNSPESFLGSNKPKKKESLYSKCISMIDDFIYNHNADNNVRQLLIQYLNLRLEMKDKPMYANQWKGILNKLESIHKQGFGYEPIIRYSLERGYASFFEPSKPNKPVGNKFVDNITKSEEPKTPMKLSKEGF